jgi:uncharacterized protein YwgA
LVEHFRDWGITSLAIPPLGCGNGQLEWRVVGPLIYRSVRQMGIPVELYAPFGTNPRELTVTFLEQSPPSSMPPSARTVQTGMSPAWIALVEILDRIEKQPYHWPVGRTIFQKIAYVATREGIPTGFHYEQGSFGPFSKDVKAAETKLINSNLLQEERLGRMFMVKPGTEFVKVRQIHEKAIAQWDSVIERTTDLFVRMNTDQAEIVATVIFASEGLQSGIHGQPSESQVLDSVMRWKQKRRPPLNPVDVASAIRNLGMLHWLKVTPDESLPVHTEEAALA